MKRIINLLAVVILAQSALLPAQTRGKITGRVIDRQTKQPLPGANVLVLGTDSGAATDVDGIFLITNIEENIYKLRVTYIGYQAHVETDVRVIRNKAAFVEDIELIQSAILSDKVVVTGSVDEDTQSPVSSYISTREQIIRAPGAAGDIFRALEAMPGVSTAGGEFSAFAVRGGSPRENLILVDNIPLGKLTHFDGGNEEEEAQGGRFSVFAPGVIEEANFRGGGFSVQYGGKFASMLDLKIREGNRENLTIDGRLDLLGWEVNYSGPTYLIKNTSLFISARHQDFNRILELTRQKDVGSPRFTDIIVKTATEINSSNKLSLLAIYAPEWMERETKHVFESDGFAETTLIDLEEPKLLLGANWRFLTSKSSYWHNTIYYSFINSKINFGRATPLLLNAGGPKSPDDIISRFIISEKTTDKEFGLRSMFNYLPTRATTLSLGIELSRKQRDLSRRQDGLDTLYVFDENDFRPDPEQNYLTTSPQQVNIDFNAGKLFFASFTRVSINPVDGLTINLGLRHEYNGFSKQHVFSPRGSWSYLMKNRTRINFATGLYYQEPSISNFTAARQNPNLKNQKSLHTILGLTHYLGDDWKITAEGYYKKLDALLVRNDRTTQILNNNGDGYAYGVDLILLKRFVKKFYGQINYSYGVSKRDDHNGEGKYNSDFNLPHIFSLLGGYEFNKEWTISVKWRYSTGKPTDSFILHKNVFNDANFMRFSKEITKNNNDRLSPFHTLNIRIDYRKQLGRLALVSFLDIVNVYNYLNVNEERFIDLTGKVEERGFKILPTGGLKLEF